MGIDKKWQKYDGIDADKYDDENAPVGSDSNYLRIHPVAKGSLERSIKQKEEEGGDLTEEELNFKEVKRKARGY